MGIPKDDPNIEQNKFEMKCREACFGYCELKIWASRLLGIDEDGETASKCFREVTETIKKVYMDYCDQARKKSGRL